MSTELNTDLLASMLRAKRGDQGLRIIAKEIGDVSAPTLSRIEQGKVPDVDTFIKICKWLGVSTEKFIMESSNIDSNKNASTKELVLSHLRADKELSVETLTILQNVIDLAYKQVKNGFQK